MAQAGVIVDMFNLAHGKKFIVDVIENTRFSEMKSLTSKMFNIPQGDFELFMASHDQKIKLDHHPLVVSEKTGTLVILRNVISDQSVLEALFDSCGGTGWNEKTGWMTKADLNDWYGVKVDANGRVIYLNLSRNNLTGGVPKVLEQLSRLTNINLSYNNFTGSIPVELSQLEQVVSIYMNDSGFTYKERVTFYIQMVKRKPECLVGI